MNKGFLYGLLFGCLLLIYPWIGAVLGLRDGIEGASAFVLIFGLPLSILGVLVTVCLPHVSYWLDFVLWSAALILNWAVIGQLLHFGVRYLFYKNKPTAGEEK